VQRGGLAELANVEVKSACAFTKFLNCLFRRIEFSVQCAAFSLSSAALRSPSFSLM
jgi:hypothetical protein